MLQGAGWTEEEWEKIMKANAWRHERVNRMRDWLRSPLTEEELRDGKQEG